MNQAGVDVLVDMDDAERAARIDLAAAYRLVALFGWDDLVFTHLSARIPGPDHHFLINPYGLLFEEITASSLVRIDLDGNPVGSAAKTNQAGFIIHSAIHMAREDAHAVMHLHTTAGQAVSAMECGLLPYTQTAMIVDTQLAYHDYEGIATDADERERLVADLGDRCAMILRNHGTLAVGSTVGECFVRLYLLERACAVQVAMLAGDQRLRPPPPDAAAKVATQTSRAGMARIADSMAWPALLRKLDRIDPSYRN